MKTRLITILIILAIGLAGVTKPAQAQAYSTSFTTSITYQNVGAAATTTLEILFYAAPDTVTPITITRANLAAGAGTSVSIGTLGTIDPGFKGSAVMQADQPLLATLVQVPAAGLVKVRPLSNGFSAGAAQSLIASVLKNQFGNNTIFSVQNVDSEANNINIKFYNTSAALVYEYNSAAPINSGASYYFDAGVDTNLGTSFNGSAVVSATRVGGAAGAIVTTALELEITTVGGKAFQGVATGATTFYMPSALCNYQVSGQNTNTSYAIQNTSLTTPTDVTVTYSNGATQTKTIGGGAKGSFVACQADAGNPMTNGFIGSATVTSTATPVVAIGKAYGAGLSTAFEGVAAGSGSAKIALPYVRFANITNWNLGTQQRVYITIQNVGAAISGDVVVQYVTCTGAVSGTHTITGGIAAGAKKNSNATLTAEGLTEFGLCGGGGPQYGGGVLITGPAGAELAAVARVVTLDLNTGLPVGEDYNGQNVP
jgi:hypothetical protein